MGLIISATKEFTFDMAHMLADHEGLCKNIHGHTYKLFVTVSRNDCNLIDAGPAEGMVVDFKELKRIVQDYVIANLDHALMLNINSEAILEKQLKVLFESSDRQKVCWVDYRPTAENMAIHIYHALTHLLQPSGIHVVKIKLYETPTSYVEIAES